MELRIRSARTTKDIDLTLHDGTRLAKDPDERRKQVRAMLQDSAAIQFNDYFEFFVGEPREELDGAPEGGSRYPVEARMDGRMFARFHVDIGIGDEVIEPVEVVKGRIGSGLAESLRLLFPGTAVCGKTARVLTAARGSREHQNERSNRYAASDSARKTRQSETCGCNKSDVCEKGDTPHASKARAAALRVGTGVPSVSPGM